MVSILKDIPIENIKIVPCRVNGPRGIVKSFIVTGEDRLILVDTGFSDAEPISSWTPSKTWDTSMRN